MRKHRKSTTKVLLASIVLTAGMGLTSYAAEWKQDNGQWQYEQDGGGYATGWNWVDGKCYYFDTNGYMAVSTEVDGYTLNASGEWIVDGVVQTQGNTTGTNQTVDNTQGQTLQFNPDDDIRTRNVTPVPVRGGEVIDGKSVSQITLNQELIGMMYIDNGANSIKEKSIILQTDVQTDYITNYRNTQLRVTTANRNNSIVSFNGYAGAILDNIPETGIELNAFYENTEFTNADAGRRTVASTGRSDYLHGLPTGTYRMTRCDVGERFFDIVLTLGYDGNWYIYPDSPAYMN